MKYLMYLDDDDDDDRDHNHYYHFYYHHHADMSSVICFCLYFMYVIFLIFIIIYPITSHHVHDVVHVHVVNLITMSVTLLYSIDTITTCIQYRCICTSYMAMNTSCESTMTCHVMYVT